MEKLNTALIIPGKYRGFRHSEYNLYQVIELELSPNSSNSLYVGDRNICGLGETIRNFIRRTLAKTKHRFSS